MDYIHVSIAVLKKQQNWHRNVICIQIGTFYFAKLLNFKFFILSEFYSNFPTWSELDNFGQYLQFTTNVFGINFYGQRLSNTKNCIMFFLFNHNLCWQNYDLWLMCCAIIKWNIIWYEWIAKNRNNFQMLRSWPSKYGKKGSDILCFFVLPMRQVFLE